jgi:hypothetical protein
VLPAALFQTLVLTDIASGWTECVALILREQTLIVEALLKVIVPGLMRGYAGSAKIEGARRLPGEPHTYVRPLPVRGEGCRQNLIDVKGTGKSRK